MTVQWIDGELLDGVSREAKESPRRRKNKNLHAMSDTVHRLLNALEPGTYIRPHRHADPPKGETALAVRGRIALVIFDDAGAVTAMRVLDARGDVVGADVPAGTWHTFVVLDPGSVFFEAKPGPYVAPIEADLASWSPAEGSAEAAAFERALVERVMEECR